MFTLLTFVSYVHIESRNRVRFTQIAFRDAKLQRICGICFGKVHGQYLPRNFFGYKGEGDAYNGVTTECKRTIVVGMS